MGRSVKKCHLPLLKILSIKGISPNLRKALLQEKGLINSCCECCLNVLNGNVKLTERQKKDLKKYKTVLRQLASKSIGYKKKHQLLVQKGSGLLPLLLIPALTALTQLFNKNG